MPHNINTCNAQNPPDNVNWLENAVRRRGPTALEVASAVPLQPTGSGGDANPQRCLTPVACGSWPRGESPGNPAPCKAAKLHSGCLCPPPAPPLPYRDSLAP